MPWIALHTYLGKHTLPVVVLILFISTLSLSRYSQSLIHTIRRGVHSLCRDFPFHLILTHIDIYLWLTRTGHSHQVGCRCTSKRGREKKKKKPRGEWGKLARPLTWQDTTPTDLSCHSGELGDKSIRSELLAILCFSLHELDRSLLSHDIVRRGEMRWCEGDWLLSSWHDGER